MNLEHIFTNDLPSIQGIVFDYLDIQWSLKKHSTPVWEMSYIDEGKVKLEIEKNIYQGGPSDIFFIPPGVFHRDHFIKPHTYRACIIFFRWKWASVFFEHINNKKIKKIKHSARLEIYSIINKIWEEFKSGKPDFKLLMNIYLQEIFVIIARNVLKPNETDIAKNDYYRYDMLNDIRRYIGGHYAEQISLQSLSEKFKISPFYLTRLFSTKYGFAPHQYLLDVRIDNAKRLLKEKKITTKKVAYMVGFEDPNYFGKVFSKIVGITPAKYQNNFFPSKK